MRAMGVAAGAAATAIAVIGSLDHCCVRAGHGLRSCTQWPLSGLLERRMGSNQRGPQRRGWSHGLHRPAVEDGDLDCDVGLH